MSVSARAHPAPAGYRPSVDIPAADLAALQDAIRILLHRLPAGVTLTASRPEGEHARVTYDDGETTTLYLPEGVPS